jgi:ubiquitin-protein ligase
MDVIICPTITTNNTSITHIKINNIEYDIIRNNTFHYIISHMQSKNLIDYINIILSNTFIKNIHCIVDIIIKTNELEEDNMIVDFDDKYYIFQNDVNTKCKMNNSLLFTTFNSHKQEIENLEMIPKDILLNKKQLYAMILSEIEKVNTNMSYPHYIYCNNDDIMDLSFRFVYLNNGNVDSLGYKMDMINMKHGYNYFELNLKLSMLYPFLPPTINYVKPQIDIDLISNIYNMELWNPTYWNRAITFDHIISNLGKSLEPYFNKYLNIENNPFDFIELKMVELLHISRIQPQNIINISLGIDIIKSCQPDIKSSNTVWKSGTGYGSRNDDTWDISTYINMINSNNVHIINIINSISQYINSMSKDYIINPSLYKYILTKLTGINLLNLNTDINIFQSIITLIDKIYQKNHTDLYINFAKNIVNNQSIKDLIKQIKLIMNDENIKAIEEQYIEEQYMAVYLYLIDTYELYENTVSKYITIVEPIIIQDDDIKSQYVRMVKENMCDMLELSPTHRYYKNRQNIIAPRTIMRIMSELSQLKNDLPVNWDSSVILRYIPSNTNMITFIISGPKDTPYHNALFEFHAYFPNGYPTEVPLVNINTTGNGKVRFNPNLYACGKVCLSLLGTWSGSKGESWIPNISTFNQVIISIQSLILVDEPFYNEPGYEQKKDDHYIRDQSFIYKDNIRFQSVKYGMIEMIRNPLPSYETFIKQHFKFKKDEIITTVEKWVKESRLSYFSDLFVELKKVLNENEI